MSRAESGATAAGGGPRRAGLAEKRAAIVRGARTVFGRDGYTRAGIDTIAKEAGVSTRTIYNHFDGGKAALFRTVIEESSTEIYEAHADAIDRHLHKITDVEADLTAFVHGWLRPLRDFPDHFALVRQLAAEIGHMPQELIEAWQEAGPRRAHRALADRLAALAADGWLRIPDPHRAAMHLIVLTGQEISSRTYQGAIPLPQATVDELVTSGVRAFLHGYLPPDAP